MKIAVQAWFDEHKQTERWFGWFECDRLAKEWAARLKREGCHVEMTVVEIDVNTSSRLDPNSVRPTGTFDGRPIAERLQELCERRARGETVEAYGDEVVDSEPPPPKRRWFRDLVVDTAASIAVGLFALLILLGMLAKAHNSLTCYFTGNLCG